MVSFNVAQLLKSATGSVREFDFRERLPDPVESVHLHGPVTGHARFMLTARGVVVQLRHQEAVELECARCLREVSVDVATSVDEEYLVTTDVRTGLPIPREPDEEESDDEHFFVDEHHEINLDELIRQTILTSLPFRPLCEATCPGLCTTCGGRLDDTHRAHPIDPLLASQEEPTSKPATSPFAVLGQLLHDEDSATES
jgi:uncharacterized protein